MLIEFARHLFLVIFKCLFWYDCAISDNICMRVSMRLNKEVPRLILRWLCKVF